MALRLTEIDALRGLAVLGMVLFHAAFDGMLLGFWEFEPYGWPLIIFVRMIQFLFLGLVGVSVALSSRGFRGQLKRGAKVFLCGMGVSAATAIFFPNEFVKFGVLHFIGVAIPLVVLFKSSGKSHPRKRRYLTLATAAASFGLGEFFLNQTVQNPWLFPLGLLSPGFASLDYFPIFPWLAAALIGLVLGEFFYAKKRPTRLAALSRVPGIIFMGRHSLAIYLLHQPVLYFSLWGLRSLLT